MKKGHYPVKIARPSTVTMYALTMISHVHSSVFRCHSKMGWMRQTLLMCVLFAAATSSVPAEEREVTGFMERISEVKLVPDSQPGEIKPLEQTKITTNVDLPLMAKWAMNYLTGT